MKNTISFLFVAVFLFIIFWISQANQFANPNIDRIHCFFYPDCDCISSMYNNWTIGQKAYYVQLMHYDFVFIVLYISLLGFWSYLEMQRQKSFWINNLLRFNIFLLVVLALSDILENIFNIYYFSKMIKFQCFHWSFVATEIKWISCGLILLFLLISISLRFFQDKKNTI